MPFVNQRFDKLRSIVYSWNTACHSVQFPKANLVYFCCFVFCRELVLVVVAAVVEVEVEVEVEVDLELPLQRTSEQYHC